MSQATRKLAEIWEVNGDYHLRVNVDIPTLRLLGARSPQEADSMARFEVVEVMRHLLALMDDDQAVEVRGDDPFLPPDDD